MKIIVDNTITAPIEKVWEYYTDPKHITNWNFANEDWHCPVSENNLEVGGKMLSRMEAKDGSFSFDFEATYGEVILNKKLAYTIHDGRKVEILFTDKGKETKILIEFDAEEQSSIEQQQGGWQAILNNFKNYTENNNINANWKT